MNDSRATIHRFTGGFAQTNSYLVDAGSGRVLVDAPEGAAEWLREGGLDPDVLFLTHQHFDHTMDAAAVVEEWGVQVYAHSAFSKSLGLAELFASFSGMSIAVPEFHVDVVLGSEAGKVELVGEEFGLLHVPGHSQDSLCLHHSAGGLLFSGDTLMAGSIGRPDLPGGDQRVLVSGIREKILALPGATVVYPGHGGPTTVAEEQGNPFLI